MVELFDLLFIQVLCRLKNYERGITKYVYALRAALAVNSDKVTTHCELQIQVVVQLHLLVFAVKLPAYYVVVRIVVRNVLFNLCRNHTVW